MSKTNITLTLIGLIVFIIFAWPLHDWMIDDAGISFAYAKNIAAGDGMVSQPGAEPVEGISNPLWTWLFVPIFWLGLFSEMWSAKVLSLFCVGASLWFLIKLSEQLTEKALWAKTLVVLATVCSAPIVIWCSSGLENPLYIALVSVLLWVTVRQEGPLKKVTHDSYFAGIIAALTALTRPEGVVFASVFPVYLILTCLLDRSISVVDCVKALGRFLCAWGVLFGGYVAFRYLYFHDIYPNTYYVKGGPDIQMALDVLWLRGGSLSQFREIAESFIGETSWLLVPIGIIACAFLAITQRRHRSAILTISFATVLSIYTYLLMTYDWMGEFRFASPVYPLVFITSALSIHLIFLAVIRSVSVRLMTGAVLAVLLVCSVWVSNHRRLSHFSAHPPTNYFYMSRLYGHKFNAYADYLGLDSASFLVPDFGGTLMHSRLRLYDLAGLCDRTIARTRQKDQKAFFDYVFESIKPTFIHTHGFFTEVSKFDDDSRFLRDYMPIYQEIDGYLKRRYNQERLSGDFVRRDAVIGREALVDSLLPVVASRPEFQ